MRFTVEYKERDGKSRYFFRNWRPELKGHTREIIITKDEIEKGSGKDISFIFNFGYDHMTIITLEPWEHTIKIYSGRTEKVSGVYYENYIKIHWKTIKEKLFKMKDGDEIEIVSWDEEFEQNKIKHDLNEVRKSINREIEKRQSYGVREIKTPDYGYIIYWSNSAARWFKQYVFILPNEKLKLDANEIFVTFTEAEIDTVIEDLKPLPLYAYSFEAKKKLYGRTETELRKDLNKLKRELEFAKEEKNPLKIRNISFTIKYIESLLGEKNSNNTEEHLK